MPCLSHKIDFLGLISVRGANPNGDPLNGGRPRIDSDGYGIVTDVCIKRKLRDRLAEAGEDIFVTPPCGSGDSLSRRASELPRLDREEFIREACERWYDVRAFGQLFRFSAGEAVSIRGPVSIQRAFSADIIEIEELPLTRCISALGRGRRRADTLSFISHVRYGLYVLKGSVNVHFAEKTGFSEEDAGKLKTALLNIFQNDSSASRPDGSMRMERLYWWKHSTSAGDLPSFAVHDTVKLRRRAGIEHPLRFEDYIIDYKPLDGLSAEILGATVVPVK